MLRAFLFIIAFLASPSIVAFAQIGDCEKSQANAELHTGNVRARMYNNGGLFWNGGQNLYEAPKGGGVSAIFASSFIIAGFIDGELRAASSDYGPYEFWPGPLDANGNPPTDCSIYDKIWEITDEDFERLDQEGFISSNMQNWPWELGAPVIDGDGNPDNYNIEAGDRPELLGNQTLWWIMNDRGNSHEWSITSPIGLEVHVSAYAFKDEGVGSDISFYRYRIINKNASPLTDTFLGMWVDPDLGNFQDDYFGSDSLLHLGYTYNADPIDENGYESQPPAMGYTFLITPTASPDLFDNDRDGEVDEPGEPAGMYSARVYFGGGGIQGDPADGPYMYNYLKGLWGDGQSITEGGRGLGVTDIPTRFMYSGDPVTRSYWSEFAPLPTAGPPIPAADRRFIVSSGPFNVPSGESTEFLLAIVVAQGADYLDSVRKLKGITASLQSTPESYLITGYQPRQPEPPPPPPEYVLGFDQNFPNPFSGPTTFRYSLPKEMHVRLSVFDMLGRELEVLVEAAQGPGIYTIEFDGSGLPAGIYYAHIVLDHLSFTRKLVIVP